MCNFVYRHSKVNNKYVENYDKNTESSYLQYLDVNNLYGWAISQELPIDGFRLFEEDDISKFDKKFKKNHDENSDKGYILEVDVEYPKSLHKLHSDLPFLPEIIKINKCTMLACTVENKVKYVIPTVALKQAIDHGLILRKVQRVIEFRQEAWLKPYIKMNTKVKMQAKNNFEKDFLKLMNNSVFVKTMENMRNHRDIKLVKNIARRSKLPLESNYHSTKYILEDLLIMDMKKTEVKMNKPVYLNQAILDISKTLTYEFWYDYIKPKYEDKARPCYMDTDSFIIHIKARFIWRYCWWCRKMVW